MKQPISEVNKSESSVGSRGPQPSTPFYIVGGTVQRDAPCYVQRRADGDLYDSLKQGKFCYVLTSRQMGKSSLMVRTAARLREEEFGVAVLDLTAIGQNLTAEQWYDGLLMQIAQQLELEDELEEFWSRNPALGPLQRWMQSLRQVVLPRYVGRLVIFIDEIDAVRSLPFSTDEFFAGIREFYNRRTEDAELKRLAFCLLGVASPSDLIRDSRTTPFNIGERIELSDFTESEAAPLVIGLRRETSAGATLLKRVLYWTGGHPYLTQRLCEAIAEDSNVSAAKDVDRVCHDLFLSHRAQERDDNLLFVRERILRGEADLASVLDLYSQVRRGKRIADEVTNPLLTVLRLSGITKVSAGYVEVRNRIYEKVFDRSWVMTNMPDAEIRRQRTAYRRGVARTAAVAAIVLIAITTLAMVAVGQRNRARREAQRADENAQQLQIALNEARAQRQRAEDQTSEAQRQREDAVAAQQLAQSQKAEADEQRRQAFAQREIATTQRARAVDGERNVRTLLYNERIKSAQENFDTGNLSRTVELLNDTLPTNTADDLRGFEWFHLWSLAHSDELAAAGSAPPVGQTMTFSPDGGLLAIAFSDSKVKLWETASHREVMTVITGDANCIAISHDRKLLATRANNGPILIWEVSTGRQVGSMAEPPSAAAKLGFAKDDRQLLSWSARFGGGAITGMILTWWDVPSQKIIATHTFEGSSGATNLSPNLELFARVFQTGIKIYDARTFRELASFKPELPAGGGLAFSSDGLRLAASGREGIQVWNVHELLDPAIANKQALLKIPAQVNGAIRSWAFAFSFDNRELAIIRQDRSLQVWNVATGQEVLSRATGALVDQIAFAPYGDEIALADKTGLIKLVRISMAPGSITFNGHEGIGRTLAFSPDNRLFAATDGSHVIRLVELASGKEVAHLKGHSGRIDALAFSPDSKLLASGANDPAIKIWDLRAGQPLRTLTPHPGTVLVSSVVFSPDGKQLLATASDGALNKPLIEIWDVETGAKVGELRGHDAPTGSLIFSPDGKRLAAANALGTITIWDYESRREIQSIQARDGSPILSLAFSPNGQRVASAGNDQIVRIWNTENGREVLTLKGHTQPVRSVSFSPDGRRLASGSEDGTVKIWSAGSGIELNTYKDPSRRAVMTVVFSADGNWLASGDHQTVTLRRAASESEVAGRLTGRTQP